MVYIGVIGGSLCNSSFKKTAYETGRYIALSGSVLVCGGMGGIMEEACRGAYEAGGVTMGILPGGDRSQGNPYLTYSVVTGIGEARNSIVVRSSDAIIAIDGAYGTLSELAFALLWNKPAAGIKTWNITDFTGEKAPVEYFEKPQQAVDWALKSILGRT